MNTNIPVKKIKRAQIRYFECDKNGCEVTDIEAYTYFINIHGVYVNIFHPLEEFNIYVRTPYGNSTMDGESFGSMLRLVNGREEDGVCFVLDKDDAYFSGRDYISCEDLEEEIINKEEFIVDRVDILRKRKCNKKEKQILKRDEKQLRKLQEYINSKENVKVLKKVEN